MARVLFIAKKNQSYGYGSVYSASGLLNSVQFLVDMLNDAGETAALSIVVDNNDIDREVTKFKPTHVVIEALWVVPEKFDVLTKLHPKVKWIVRVHSDIPFLAEEGIAVEWLLGYLKPPRVSIAFNSERAWKAFNNLIGYTGRVLYLPNFYPLPEDKPSLKPPSKILKVGCFGAIREMKNQLMQALAAIQFADTNGYMLEFHINASRTEGWAGKNVLKNLEQLFKFSFSGHKLVEHPWMSHADFLKLMATMDVSMAVSMTETFCIVAADAIATGVPLVCSDQVPWASRFSEAEINEDSIISKLGCVTGIARNMIFNLDYRGLKKYVSQSKKIWLNYLSQ